TGEKDGDIFFSSIETLCNNFLTNYDDSSTEIPLQKLSYKNWRESEEVLKDILVEILETLPLTESSPKENTYISNIKSSIPPEQKKGQGMVKDFMANGRDGEKKAKEQKIGIDKIQYTKSYTANSISRFTNLQIQMIINHFTKNSAIEFIDNLIKTEINEEAKRISLETELSITTTLSILLSHTYNSEVMINENVKSLPETKVSISAKLISKEPETVNIFDKYNENDGEFSDDNDDKFSDDNDDGDYCGFSDKDKP
ncbi:11590_t:CDS:2, partial [Dentiscutata erythropus]